MAGKTLILPKSDGTLGSIDELEWRRRAEERRLGPLVEILKEDAVEEDLGETGGLRQRIHYYGAMAGGHHGHHHDHDSDHD